MSELAVNIERVVREVLAELGVAPRATIEKSPGDAKKQPALSTAIVPSVSPKSAADELVVSSRVVTMNDVLGRLDGVRRVVAPKGAIVTPAVRDELLRRGIALAHENSRTVCSVASGRVVVMTMGTKFESEALAAGLARENLKVERAASDCIIAAVDALAKELGRSDTLAVLLTPHVAAAVCLANRLPGVRAMTACDVPTAGAVADGIGANLLAVAPDARTFFQLKQIVSEFCRCGVRPCPIVFRQRLA